MEFGVLGPLEVSSGGAAIDVRKGIPRTLLLALIVRAGEAVEPDTLAEVIWGDELPANPANALQTQVSYLRKALATGEGDRRTLVTRPSGYVLDVPPDSVDAFRFLRTVDRARHLRETATVASWAASLAELDDALGLWRGSAFVDAAGAHFAMSEVTRLEEARLIAQEARAECLLALGRHGDASADLASFVAAHPLRERGYELLMVAHYRSGRQADALRTYDTARSTLLDELGLDPGPSLQRTQQLVLDQAPELDWVPLATEVTIPDVAAGPSAPDAPAPAAARARPPVPTASLIGRDAEVSKVSELLASTRAITLTGPAGAGKTSLALEVARRSATVVSFVDLDGITDDSFVPAAVATALGCPTSPGTDPLDAIIKVLSEAPALLVLDTCEHVVDGAARTASTLLARCADLQVLATSRRLLSIRGEIAWPVPPLDLPSPDASAAEIGEAPAVALFAQRAAAVRPGFTITDANARDVATICDALDGLPLAIELAAARADTLSPAAIGDRLRDRFTLLVDGGRDAAPRQQTLRAALDWSLELLTPEERSLFLRLSVYNGQFGLEDVAAVAADDIDDPLRRLAALVRQSMVAVAGEDRYHLLDSPRAYARELLTADPTHAAVYESALRHHVALAERAADGLWTGHQQRFIADLRAALPNLRGLIEWGFEHDHAELAARIVGSLSWFLMLEAMFIEGLAYCERAESFAGDLSRFARAGVAYARSLMTAPLGRLEEARRAAQESVDLAREGRDDPAAAAALSSLGVAEWALGDLDAAAQHQDEAVELYHRAGDVWRRSDAQILRARIAIDQGDPAARELVDAVVAQARSVGDLHSAGLAWAQLSLVSYAEGDYEAALQAAEESRRAHSALGTREGIAGALHLVGQAELARGDLEAARDAHRRGLELAVAIGHVGATCEAVEDFAAIAIATGEPDRARELLAAASTERAARGVPRRPSEQARISELRQAADEAGSPEPAGGTSFADVLVELRASEGKGQQQART